jgi:BCD family chlorophyll transporter-like MFS transporter
MMIAGFVVTTAAAGRLLDPYSPARLVAVSAGVCALAFLLASVAVWGVEPRRAPAAPAVEAAPARPAFRDALRQVWAERDARRFAVFVFVSMLAYSAQGPRRGALRRSGVRAFARRDHAARLRAARRRAAGHGRGGAGRKHARVRPNRAAAWLTVGGCVGAAVSVLGLAALGLLGEARPIAAACFAVGLGDGVFAAGAIASMMHLAGHGGEGRAGIRMGVWGAAQAIAFGLGGLAGTAAVDGARLALGASPSAAYGLVFAADALLFLWAAFLAVRVGRANGAAANGEAPHSASAGLGARLA